MKFWNIEPVADRTAAIDARTGKRWTCADLSGDTARVRTLLPRLGRKSLGLVLAQNRYECLVIYLAALQSDTAIILLDATLQSALLVNFLDTYQPDWIFTVQPDAVLPGYRNRTPELPGLFEKESPQDIEIHPDLALLLSTSGSTGSPKLVRLTLNNLAANARSIAQYLELTPREVPITALPFSYSFGLSVVNSHLHAGAPIVFTEDGVLRKEFWDAVDRYGVTSFGGVPYTYQLLLKAGLLNSKGQSLRTLTQAGGRLEEHYIRQMYELAVRRGWKFFVMYGQTEATARISYVPFERLASKLGAVGVAIPNGSLTLDQETGELIYSGPNVMLGYATRVGDLAKGDELGGVLRTGDLARRDLDGYFYITGRSKRFLKMFGKRYNLDDLEKILSRHFGAIVACYGRDDLLTVAVERDESPQATHQAVCDMFDLPRSAVKTAAIGTFPLSVNGKLDYQRLADTVQNSSVALTQ